MNAANVRAMLRESDTSDMNEVWDCWRSLALRPLDSEALGLVAQAYAETKHWQARVAQLYYTTGFARTYPESLELALTALDDRSLQVRYRACAFLAYSQRKSAIRRLKQVAQSGEHKTRPYARAAISAIEAKDLSRFEKLDSRYRAMFSLPLSLPRRSTYVTFANDFHALAGKWLVRLGFEAQSIFQNDAFYRRGDLWFHAHWEEWDVVRMFMLGKREKLERSLISSEGISYGRSSRELKDVCAALEIYVRKAIGGK